MIMGLTEEQIKNILCKDIVSKTILINKEDEDRIIEEHLVSNWKIVSHIILGNKVKITFQKTINKD